MASGTGETTKAVIQERDSEHPANHFHNGCVTGTLVLDNPQALVGVAEQLDAGEHSETLAFNVIKHLGNAKLATTQVDNPAMHR